MANPHGRQYVQQQHIQKRLTVQEFSAKFNNKREVYTFLTVDCERFCPPIDTVTIWHLKDMACGLKGSVLCKDIHKIYVPNYEELTLEKVVAWVNRHHPQFCRKFFPVERELMRFPRTVSSTATARLEQSLNFIFSTWWTSSTQRSASPSRPGSRTRSSCATIG